MSGTIKVGDTNITITDNHSSDIALASFCGYIATTAELSAKYGGQPGEKVLLNNGGNLLQRNKNAIH